MMAGGRAKDGLQFFRELPFIEVPRWPGMLLLPSTCSSFGNCPSLR